MAVGNRRTVVGRSVCSFVIVLAIGSSGCIVETGGKSGSFSGPTMGTVYSARYVAGQDADTSAPALKSAVDARLADINRMMSTYDPGSELSRFNKHAGADWFAVSEETAKVVAFALGIAEDSGGAFDPTVGPAVNLWGFGPDGRRKAPPTDEEVAAALARVGYKKVEARLDPPALRKTAPDVYLDLSAIAKGYASDAVADLLGDQGATGCMVEIGGEVATRGTKPGDDPWRIGVEKPSPDGESLQEVVELTGEALATSGDYRNFFESGGDRYSHTIDPTTGRPVTHTTASVSVRAETCMEADALATTLLVLGADRGYDWAVEREVAALFVTRAEDGFAERKTPSWDAQP